MKAVKICGCFIAMALTNCGEFQETSQNSVVETPSNPEQFEGNPPPGYYRDQILKDLGIAQIDDYSEGQLALAAREFVYLTNQEPEGEVTPIDVTIDFASKYEDWKIGDAKFLCGGSSYVLAWMLEDLGIPARAVQLATQNFIDGFNKDETHVTTEVFLNGQWIIEDATFNVSFSCDGKEASILDLAECLKSGEKIAWNPGDKYGGFGHTVEDYPVPFADHLAAYSMNNPYISRLRYEQVLAFPYAGWDQ
jgi:hypothetical protein